MIEKDIYDFWQRAPCGTSVSRYEFGSKDFFKDIDDWRQRIIGSVEDDLIDYARYKNSRVLELGCGMGSEAMKFVKHGADYVGLDLTQVAADATALRLRTFDLPGKVLQHDATDPGLPAVLGQFDAVFSFGVMHHWPDLSGFLCNAWNFLIPGGEFVFVVYAKPSWQFAMYQAGLGRYEAADGCPYVQVYDEHEIRGFLAPSFRMTQIVQYGCFMYNVEQYRRGKLVLEPWFAIMPAQMRSAVDNYLGKYYLVRAIKQGDSYVFSS